MSIAGSMRSGSRQASSTWKSVLPGPELARRKAYTARTFKRPSAEWAKLTETGAIAGQRMLTDVIPPQKRSTAFGLFDTGYGIAWFVGSAVMGLLYDKSILAVALFSVVLQLAAIPVFFVANKRR